MLQPHSDQKRNTRLAIPTSLNSSTVLVVSAATRLAPLAASPEAPLRQTCSCVGFERAIPEMER